MKRRRLFLTAFFGLVVGLGGETLLFLQRQCARLESVLRDDFRVLFFLKADLPEGQEKVLEERLRAVPGVEEARYVSRQEALATLRRDDPELVESVSWLSDNPLLPAFEARLDDDGLAQVSRCVGQAQGLTDWAEIRYKPSQVQAILQAQFYRHFIGLALSAAACLTVLLALAALWEALGQGPRSWSALWHGLTRRGHAWLPFAAGAGGAAFGAAAVTLAAFPARLLAPWADWPSTSSQALLVAGTALAGWVLCARGD